MENKPWKATIVRGRGDFPKERVAVAERAVAGAANLRDLGEQYHFYTPALLYLHVRLMGREPFHDFLDEYGKVVVPISMKFDKPLFKGLEVQGNSAWNHYLYGMEHEHFIHYLRWLGSLAISDPDRGLLTRMRYREIEIPDSLYLAKIVTAPAEVPMIKIVAFCLDTNKGCHYMEPGRDPLLDLPQARYTRQSFDDTVRFTQALSQGANPYEVEDRRQAKDGLSLEEREIRERIRRAREVNDDSERGNDTGS